MSLLTHIGLFYRSLFLMCGSLETQLSSKDGVLGVSCIGLFCTSLLYVSFDTHRFLLYVEVQIARNAAVLERWSSGSLFYKFLLYVSFVRLF